MEEILKKIYHKTPKQAVNDILNIYEKNGFVVSNFLYFAIIKVQKLFESGKKTSRQKEYKKSIMKWDFLFPDGIALQTFYKIANKRFDLPAKKLANLNGTDFLPYFLDDLKKKYGWHKICLFLHWAKPDIIPETKKYLEYKWFNVVYTQDWYSELDREKLNKSRKDYQDTIDILLVARSTPDNPIQELWSMKNRTKIKENKLIVFTVWWLFDFWAAEANKKSRKKWTQKRAPKLVRKIKLERLWRLITDPKRNFKKVKNSFAVFPYIFRYLLLKKE